MSVRGVDGGGILAYSEHFGLDYDRPILPPAPRVLTRYSEPGHYPNTMTPRSIEQAIRDRVAEGTDVFEATRQVLEGVARWAAEDR